MENLGNVSLTNGQRKSVDNNIGKQVKVALVGDNIATLFIQDGTVIMGGTFRYVMHTEKNPEKPFRNDPAAIHYNIDAGYCMVDPMRIIL